MGTILLLAGLLLVAYSAAAYLDLLPGGYTSVPEPVALSGSAERRVARQNDNAPTTAMPASVAAPVPVVTDVAPSVPPAAASAVAPPAAARAMVAADAGERHRVVLAPADAAERLSAAQAGRPGEPVRLQISSINVDTEVKPGGLVKGRSGELEWETLPFVAAHYSVLGPVGGVGNPVISGHVVTLREGNVFRELYKVELGEPIEVFTADSHFTYIVDEIKLVLPTATEVMEPAEDARVTIITCGGTFDPRTRTFSERLIVIGKLLDGRRLRAES